MPISPEHAVSLVQTAMSQRYNVSVEQLGGRNADTDARQFTQALGLPSETLSETRKILLNRPDAHLYEGVVTGMQSLLSAGDTVVIWTEGETAGFPDAEAPGFHAQERKVVKSNLRRLAFGKTEGEVLSAEEKARFRVVTRETDKVALIPDLLLQYQKSDIQHIALADDKAKNILRVSEQVEAARELGFTGEVELVWVRQGRSKDAVPAGYTVDTFMQEFSTVSSFTEYVHHIAGKREEWGGKPVGHLLDWDHTLADETARKHEIVDLIARDLGDRIGETQYMSPDDPRHAAICELLDIPSFRTLVEPLGEGASLVGVYKVNWNGETVVVKHENNQERKWRLTDEISGHDRLLQDGAITSRMPHIREMHMDHPVLGPTIVMDYLNGPNLRHAIREGIFTDDEILDVVGQVFDTQFTFWERQKQKLVRTHTSWFSMPGAEWGETLELMDPILESLGRELDLPGEQLRHMPLVVESDGVRVDLPSFNELISRFHALMRERPPVVLALGYNDLSHGNVVALKQRDGTMQAKIVDPQWVREQSDPRADLVRPIKAISATTVKIRESTVREEDGTVVFWTVAEIPALLRKIESHAFSRLHDFAALIGDPGLPGGVMQHMAASQFREIALVAKGRGKMSQIGFNLFNIARYLELAERFAAQPLPREVSVFQRSDDTAAV